MITSASSEIKVSVIVPIYNVERYIERCARSLMEQTLEGIEFIFVDDCGTDTSVEILIKTLADYPQRAANIILIHNEQNLGLSRTRKKGFETAHGEYLITCDSDDWVEPDAYQKLYDQAVATQADIVVCDYYQEASNSCCRSWKFSLDHEAKKCLQQIHDNRRFSWTVWNQLIRRRIIIEAIQKVHSTTYAEDIYTMIHAYWLANTVAHVAEPLYHYNLCNTQSVMTQRRWPKDIWSAQRKNIDDIVQMLNPVAHPEYSLVCQWLKFKIKEKLQSAFDSRRAYFETYRESHADIMHYGYIPHSVRCKLCVIYSCYPAFWLYQTLKS